MDEASSRPSERRRQSRVPVLSFQVHLLLRRFGIVPSRVAARALDLSLAGLALETAARLHVDQQLLLHIEACSAQGSVVINTLPIRIRRVLSPARYGASFEFAAGSAGDLQRQSVQRLLTLMRPLFEASADQPAPQPAGLGNGNQPGKP